MQIRPINTTHVEELSCLAKNIYKEYYLHLWLPGGAEWYMDEYAYGIQTLYTELADANNLHYIVDENEQPIGYLKIKLNGHFPFIKNINCIEIERIYLSKNVVRKGIGTQLMQMAETIARAHNKEMIFLKAMDTSIESIAFYQKNGFTVCGTLKLPFTLLKDEFRGMVILQKRIL